MGKNAAVVNLIHKTAGRILAGVTLANGVRVREAVVQWAHGLVCITVFGPW